MLGDKSQPFGQQSEQQSNRVPLTWVGAGQSFQTAFDLWLFPSHQVSQHGQPPFIVVWIGVLRRVPVLFSLILPFVQVSWLASWLDYQCFPRSVWFSRAFMWDLCSLECKLLLATAVLFAEGKCFGGKGTMKSNSCSPSCQKLSQALVMLPCHQTASSIEFFIIQVWLCWHTSVHTRKKWMALSSVWDWHVYLP